METASIYHISIDLDYCQKTCTCGLIIDSTSMYDEPELLYVKNIHKLGLITSLTNMLTHTA